MVAQCVWSWFNSPSKFSEKTFYQKHKNRWYFCLLPLRLSPIWYQLSWVRKKDKFYKQKKLLRFKWSEAMGFHIFNVVLEGSRTFRKVKVSESHQNFGHKKLDEIRAIWKKIKESRLIISVNYALRHRNRKNLKLRLILLI